MEHTVKHKMGWMALVALSAPCWMSLLGFMIMLPNWIANGPQGLDSLFKTLMWILLGCLGMAGQWLWFAGLLQLTRRPVPDWAIKCQLAIWPATALYWYQFWEQASVLLLLLPLGPSLLAALLLLTHKTAPR